MAKIQLSNHYEPIRLLNNLPSSLEPSTWEKIFSRTPNTLLTLLQKLQSGQLFTDCALVDKVYFIALMGYYHPVMAKEISECLKKLVPTRGFWALEYNMRVLMEILTILCLIPQFDCRILGVGELPVLARGSYEEGLWLNILPQITKGEHYLECQSLQSKATKDQIIQVRDFLNDLHLKREEFRAENLQQYQQIEQLSTIVNYYHEIDIKISEKGLLTIDYFPDQYSKEFIEVWIDQNVELNALLGNFVCKEQFGQFEYVRGPLLYAMQKGILFVMNNFQQISNELLIAIKSLSTDNIIHHNQKKAVASVGFRIVGVSSNGRKRAKSMIDKVFEHYSMPKKDININFDKITNQTNRGYLIDIFQQNQSKIGYLGQQKLWKRIQRLRSTLLNVSQQLDPSNPSYFDRLWNSYFTQDFKQSIKLQIQELLDRVDITRQISCVSGYKKLQLGRCVLAVEQPPLTKIVHTQYSLAILQRLLVSNELGECPLLISQTGCGKTTLVQYLAEAGGHKLYVYNMSSGTDVSDFIGGFKPVDCRILLKELFANFIDKFRSQIVLTDKHERYLGKLIEYYQEGKLDVLLKSLVQSVPKILEQVQAEKALQWMEMAKRFESIHANLEKIDSNLVFSFMEGNLLKAMRNGDWVLIDEINLATNDVLQKIVPLAEGKSLMLYEKGDLHYVQRHPNFKLIACMNPATDSGKKPLPQNLLSKFTSITMGQPCLSDVQMMIREQCPQLNQIDISTIYFRIKQTKTISLRNLSRAMQYINRNKQIYGWNRSVYDGLMLGFGEKEILKGFYNDNVPKCAEGQIAISGFLLVQGPERFQTEVFHLTNTFKEHLKDLLRAIAGTQLPVLLQGPTSVGKTSMIRYVAETAGYRCVRINNHQHTEVEEYIGNYFPDRYGKLVFREGPLVQAVRQGHWLILDQLNLAKTEILECLNRLLDDNRELFIPQQQKHLKPHPRFRIFATQNPASYSGRKTLSRAFRNRFVCLSFDDITIEDTMAILQARSLLLKDSKELYSLVKKTLDALVNYRQRQRVFEKDGLITIRNLLKWCSRPYISKENFVLEGYAILAQKLRNEAQKQFVDKVLLTNNKYTSDHVKQQYRRVVSELLNQQIILKTGIYVQLNDSFIRMAALALKAVQNKQPVLLIGETGCGKTTFAELLAKTTSRKLYSINCHKHMQASDLLGSLRPCIKHEGNQMFQFVNGVVVDAMLEGAVLLIDEINTAEDSVLQRLNQVLQSGQIGIQRGDGWQTVIARQGFCIIATMNPSGDYGKKELSPALRNRFTEIWVEPITHPQYIIQAQIDIRKMIKHKVNQGLQEQKEVVSKKLFQFVVHYNCSIAPKHNLMRRLFTLRDVGVVCQFINEYQLGHKWKQKYYWALRILAIEGIRFTMTDQFEEQRFNVVRLELMAFISAQSGIAPNESNLYELAIVQVLKNMNFPLLIRTNLPLQVLGVFSDEKIFFTAQTELSDLLGQYRPEGKQFIWHDQPLLKRIKMGGRTTLVDLNLAQQQVIEGINSLFDHRGNIFVVQLNTTFTKHETFRPIVWLKEGNIGGRKGLPNSFLNRFVKLVIRDVSLETKINYICRKYDWVIGVEGLRQALQNIIKIAPKIQIEQLELFVQLTKYGYASQASQIIGITKEHLNSLDLPQFPALKMATENELLKQLPLKSSLNLHNEEYIKVLMKMYVILTKTTFSICIVGNPVPRSHLVQGLAQCLGKRTKRILLSTMTEIGDLLGSYEQVSQDLIDQQTSLQQCLQPAKEAYKYRSEKTKFVYLQSKIVDSLGNNHEILYIEVPNETMLERVEKGLKNVYEQSKQIIIGLNEINKSKVASCKLVIMEISNQHSNNCFLADTEHFYPSNQSTLIHSDIALRQEQTMALVAERINQESSRQRIIAWRRLASNFQMVPIEEDRNSLLDNIRKQESDIIQIRYCQHHQRQKMTEMLLNCTNISNNLQEFRNKTILYLLFSSTASELSRRMSLWSEKEEYFNSISNKFQTLYICDLNGFRGKSLQILSVIFSNNYDERLVSKFFDEVIRLYDELYRSKIKQVLVQFNQNQYKLVPILNSITAIKHQMRNQSNSPIRELCGQSLHISHVCKGIQKVVLEAVANIGIDIPLISRWISQMKVKNINEMSLLQISLQKRKSLTKNLLKDTFVIELLQQLRLYECVFRQSEYQMGSFLFNVFRPVQDMSLNISYHLRNQIQLRSLKTAVRNDEEYLKVYNQFCNIKYSQYHPHQLRQIETEMAEQISSIASLSKKIVYRGHDNIQSLIEFYNVLLAQTIKLESKSFDIDSIKSAIRETFQTYDCFSDILLPYYLSLLVMLDEKVDQQRTALYRPYTLSLIGNNLQQIESALSAFLQRDDQQIDRSKDYVRYQKKFNRTVIIDQQTQQGVAKNKQRLQEEFLELFGKQSMQETSRNVSVFENIHMLLNRTTKNYYHYLAKKVLSHATTYEEMVIGMSLIGKYEQKQINIYEEYNPLILKQLVKPLPAILEQIHSLLQVYQTDNIKQLGTLCEKIYEHSLFDEIYKVLIDCEFLIEKTFEVNSVLPMVNHVHIDSLIENCLTVRRLQLKNWKHMLDLKIRRTEKSDMLQFIDFYRSVCEVSCQKELFVLSERFLREAKLSCLRNRINFLSFFERSKLQGKYSLIISLQRVIGFYRYLLNDIAIHENKLRDQKCKQMHQYEKLVGWNSQQYLIFKATCEKFQRKIHHILKRFEEELGETVGQFHVKLQNEVLFNSVGQLAIWMKSVCDQTQAMTKISRQNKKKAGRQIKVSLEVNNRNNEEYSQQIPEPALSLNKIAAIEQQQSQNPQLEYEELLQKVFQSLSELSGDHHSTQSKLLVIRAYVVELEELFEGFIKTAKIEYKYLAVEMFESREEYQRGVKYYYGIWDKLCQRAETKWNREIVDRMWTISEKLWISINQKLQLTTVKLQDDQVEDLQLLFKQFLQADKSNMHQIFVQEIKAVQQYLQSKRSAQQKLPETYVKVTKQVRNMMKLCFVLCSITLNLQQKGLCGKEGQEGDQQSGTDEIGQGLGVGQGDVHEQAENVGDQIQFQQQIQGHKDEQQNFQNNAGKKQENDIQMEGDFNGQMYSKSEQQGSQSGDGKEIDEEMGQVQEKEDDMKNDQGQAEGKEELDMEIKGQLEGEQELVDNEREEKEQRKGEQREQQEAEDEEEEREDWQDDDGQGQKINKQAEDVQEHERQEDEQDGQGQSISGGVDDGEQHKNVEEEKQLSQSDKNKESCQNQSQQSEKDEDNEMDAQSNGEAQVQQQFDDNQQEAKQNAKKPRKTPSYLPAYGRNDMNTNQQLIEQQNEPKDGVQQGEQKEGGGDGQSGQGNPIHDISVDFLEQIQNKKRSDNKDRYLKDVNVVIHDEDNQSISEGQEEQYELTDQQNKFATELPLMDNETKMVDEKEEDKKQVDDKESQRKQMERQEKTKEKKDERQGRQGKNKQKKKIGKVDNIVDKNTNQAKDKTVKNRQINNESQSHRQKNLQQIDKQQPEPSDKDKQIYRIMSEVTLKNVITLQNVTVPFTADILNQCFEISKVLEQQLKSVLEPMDNAEYRGDFKTGKKLNLKKIIPFIASNYRKDRIWLRRTQPSQRNYSIMLGLDDTKSMHYGSVGEQALKGLLAISMALEHLSIKTCVAAIRDQTSILKTFEEQLNSHKIIDSFSFNYESSNSHDISMALFMKRSIQTFVSIGEQETVENRRLCFIISDGKMNKNIVKPYMRQVKRLDITYVFIIVDSLKSSILDIKTVKYVNGVMRIQNYMSDFPFEYFLVINDVKELGEVLAMTLLQFIQNK